MSWILIRSSSLLQGPLMVSRDAVGVHLERNSEMHRRIVLIVVLMALAAAACGGSGDGGSGIASLENDSDELITAMDDGPAVGDGSSETQAPDEEVDTEESMLAFAACMRENGVDMADPTVDENGNLRLPRPAGAGQGDGSFDREAMLAARDACQEHLDGVVQQFQQIDQTELQDSLLEYAACMRDNGYDMADPDLSGGLPASGQGGGRGLLGDIDREDPAFQAANEVCQELFAGIRPGGGLGLGGQGR